MNLAYPTALLWSLLAIPIVIFYILKIRLRRVPVSTILFWRQIFEEKQPRSIWQHLRHLLSLLIQIFFLLLLVFALAEPFFNWEILEARRLVLVVDNSASMNAVDADATLSRLARAKEEGRRVLEAIRFRDEAAIVAAGTQPQVVCGMTGHQKTLLNALDGINPSDGPTRVKEAVELARRLVADQENGKVIVLSDGCWPTQADRSAVGTEKAADADRQAVGLGNDVQLILVGQSNGNVGITRFQVRRSLLDPIGYEILAEVVNHGDEPVECRLEVELENEEGKSPAEVKPLKLAANGQWREVLEKVSANGGRLVATLKTANGKEAFVDALAADNQAVALLPRREMQPVLLVTAEANLFLEKVFEANPLVKLNVAKELPKTIPAGTLVVLHRAVPQKLPAGHLLVIEPTGPCDLWQVGDKLQNRIVTKQDKDSPLLAHVKLDNVLMPEARKLTLQTQADALGVGVAVQADRQAVGLGAKTLVQALSGDPLYAAIERPEGKVLVLTVNLEQGDLPLRTAFPILVMNALAWFAGNQGELREALATGAVSEIELKPAPAGAVLVAPDGQERRLPDGVTRTTIGPLDQVGVWSVVRGSRSVAGSDEQQTTIMEIAVNLANREESDLRPMEGLVSSQEHRSGLAVVGLNRPIWYWLIAVAWLLAAVEWYLYQRRWIS